MKMRRGSIYARQLFPHVLITAGSIGYQCFVRSLLSPIESKEKRTSELSNFRRSVDLCEGGEWGICMLICLFLYLPSLRASVC
jgi:hypothetical protein